MIDALCEWEKYCRDQVLLKDSSFLKEMDLLGSVVVGSLLFRDLMVFQ